MDSLNADVLYGSNGDRPEFFEELFDKVNGALDYPVVIVGDWNLVLDPEKKIQNFTLM